MEKERRRKVMSTLVRIPLESEFEELGEEKAEGEKEKGRKMSSIVREPLGEEMRKRKLEEMEDDLGFLLGLELVSRDQHSDEISDQSLPPSIDIYLPGFGAWDDLRPPPVVEDTRHQFGDRVSFSPPLSLRSSVLN